MQALKILFIVSVFAAVIPARAQDTRLENTDIIYESGHFSKAIAHYKKILDNAPTLEEEQHIYSQIARAYYQLNYKDSALVYYQKVQPYTDLNAQDQFQFLQAALAQSMPQQEYNSYLQQSKQLAPGTRNKFESAWAYTGESYIEAQLYDSTIHQYHVIGQGNFVRNGKLYTALPFNTDENDFPYGITHLPILDTGIAHLDSTHYWDETYFSVSPWINSQQTEIWYASNITERKKYNQRRIVKWGLSDRGSNPLKIYKSEKKNGVWTKSDSIFEWEQDSFNYLHPFVDEAHEILYFSSNRNGDGDYDLFYVPLNRYPQTVYELKAVNTSYNEIFPMITQGYLVFSCDGRTGYGGYDLFRTSMRHLDQIALLPAPINSAADDFNWVEIDENHYLFSSDRTQQNGTDNWYMAEVAWNTLLTIYTSDQNGRLPQIPITVKGPDIDTLVYSSAQGEASIIVTDPKAYTLSATYKNQVIKESSPAYLHPPIYFVFTTPEIVLPTMYFDFDEYKITEEAEQKLMTLLAAWQEDPPKQILLVGHTDSRGSLAYNQVLSEKRALAVKQWLSQHGVNVNDIRIQGKSYLDPAIAGDHLTEVQHHKNRRVEIIIP